MSDKEEPCKVCNKPSQNKCSSCKMASYCSKEHQKEDWKNHKEACRPFEIKSTAELGRYLEATRRISSGDVLFAECPIVFGPRPDEFVCLGCYSPEPQERCPQCFWPICSDSCTGLSQPEHHAAECIVLRIYSKQIRYVKDDFFRYEAILPLRCLLLQRRNPKKWKALLEMESHMKKRGPNTEAYKQTQKIVEYLQENILKPLEKIESESEARLFTERTPEIIHKICGILDVNCLEITLPNQAGINAIYPTAYLMEHNCLPNTRHVFQSHPSKNFRLTVLANQDIQPGNHISTMYTHALWGTQQRQDHLRSTKYFTCRCRRCGDPSEMGSYFSALKCLAPDENKKICGGSQLPIAPIDISTEWRCDKCPTSLTSAQVSELVSMIGREVDLVQHNQPTVESLQALLDKLRKLLHKNHYHCYTVMHSLIQLYGRQPGFLPEQMNDALLERKIKMCNELLRTTSLLDPTASRLPLYSSVIELELANTIMILAKRKTWTGNELKEKLKETRDNLLRTEKLLKPEEEDSSGAKVLEVISQKVLEIEAFCRKNLNPMPLISKTIEEKQYERAILEVAHGLQMVK